MQAGKNSATFTIPGGSSIEVPGDLRLMTPFVLAEQGDWFESEIHFIRRWLGPGMGVIDIGANYGIYTLTCAKLVGPEGRVWAYEPASLPRSFLNRSVAGNGFNNVEVIDRALSDHEGSARMGIAENAELNSLNEAGQSGETVALTTLDGEAESFGRDIDFVKLDAEGEEVRILSRAQKFFSRQDPLVMFEYKHGATVNHGLLDAISALGMGLYRHLPGLNVLVPLTPSDADDGFLLNVFGCSPERAQSLAAQGLLVSENMELPEIEVAGAGDFVADWVEARPWSRCLWPTRSAVSDRPGALVYLAAIAELIRAEDPQRGIVERIARARRGMANLLVSIRSECNVSRLLSAARVAMDLGQRSASVVMLGEIAKGLAQAGADVASWVPEPFLPPDRRHDDLSPANPDAKDLLSIMVEEPLLERCAFSQYFLGKRGLPLLERVAQNPLHSAAATRRIIAARQVFVS